MCLTRKVTTTGLSFSLTKVYPNESSRFAPLNGNESVLSLVEKTAR